jgi:lipopolysaccharide transport system ATP-binding protein
VFGTNSFHVAPIRETYDAGDEIVVRFDVLLNLGAGAFTLTAAVHSDATHLTHNYDWWDKVIGFQMVPGPAPSFIGTARLPVEIRVERSGAVAGSARLDGPF